MGNKYSDMTNKNGYPSAETYKSRFKTWNNALEIANLPLNKTGERRTGLETCCKCGNYLKQGQHWHTKELPKGEVMCLNCYQNIYRLDDYKNGKLDNRMSINTANLNLAHGLYTLKIRGKLETFTAKISLF